jgi:hypothetical protein
MTQLAGVIRDMHPSLRHCDLLMTLKRKVRSDHYETSQRAHAPQLSDTRRPQDEYGEARAFWSQG